MTYPHASAAPFPESNALSKHRLRRLEHELSRTENESNIHIDYIPGEPSIKLTRANAYGFLSSELSTPLLDELYDALWLVARKSGKSIDSLNIQRVKSRDIIATEDVRLHLVWHRNRIYIKPMPVGLLNYDFWATYLAFPNENTTPDQHISTSKPISHKTIFDRKIALGFMRSYAFLVRHRIDFVLAREAHLFPTDLEWEEWNEFISHFRNIEDDEVAKRYHYGQLRLSRLNWIVRLLRPSSSTTTWFYEIPHWSIGMYVERAVTPLLFGFASLSLVLSSMQVLLAVPDEGLGLIRGDGSGLVAMRRAFWVFSVMVLLMSAGVWVLLVIIPLGGLLRGLVWGWKNRGKIDADGVAQREQDALRKV
ncbi:hypothetical protein N0V90_011277 [Kalmusia sp. IMI 367209]|nr:hypothetical protein N0V90_011277 [Kalmusia sp. IMI 367209]